MASRGGNAMRGIFLRPELDTWCGRVFGWPSSYSKYGRKRRVGPCLLLDAKNGFSPPPVGICAASCRTRKSIKAERLPPCTGDTMGWRLNVARAVVSCVVSFHLEDQLRPTAPCGHRKRLLARRRCDPTFFSSAETTESIWFFRALPAPPTFNRRCC